ncbi:hypothetical protein [Evansella cellulosilytica]|uniref:Uncharacterized protein n=1 Tax=Evansella cellulosilytica (strain ATCC 21833 / DSM 2522 / FERM P-1141 / JCM 9156 / N-4) TaxID=649639 RepID=E6TZ80_EVAC2|nr:hypothetical protein [Evansella cellulosilytica]ADU28942.1 hypothetical protein Bcell_0660 [Evansella cellulosilytica DSM 2522]
MFYQKFITSIYTAVVCTVVMTIFFPVYGHLFGYIMYAPFVLGGVWFVGIPTALVSEWTISYIKNRGKLLLKFFIFMLPILYMFIIYDELAIAFITMFVAITFFLVDFVIIKYFNIKMVRSVGLWLLGLSFFVWWLLAGLP